MTRERVHGTNAGYLQHYRRGEKPCEPCLIAKNTYTRGGHEKKPLAPCGTKAGYMRHWRKGEAACRLCLDANNGKTK